VQVSNDLASWRQNQDGQAPVTATVGQPLDNADGTFTTTVRDLVPLGSGKRFLRILVTGP
jgi:hypothetical protein